MIIRLKINNDIFLPEKSIADYKNCCIFASQFSGIAIKNGAVVQLVRIPACHAGGRGFESRPFRKKRKPFIINRL